MKINGLLSPEKIQLIEKLAFQHDLKNVRIHPPTVGNEKQSINLLVDLKDEKIHLNQVDFLQFELSEQLGYSVRVKTRIHFPLQEYEKRQVKAVDITENDKIQHLLEQNDYELEEWHNPMPPKNESGDFQRFTFKAPIKYPPIPLPPNFHAFFAKNKRSLNTMAESVPSISTKEEQLENKPKKAKHSTIEEMLDKVESLELGEVQLFMERLEKRQQFLLANCKSNDFDNSNSSAAITQKN